MWKRYMNKSSDEFKESTDWRKLTYIGDQSKDAIACVRYEKEIIAEGARNILKEKTIGKGNYQKKRYGRQRKKDAFQRSQST